MIKGARTRIKNPTGVYVDAVNNELWVASMGNYTATVFPLTATGNAAPVRSLREGTRAQALRFASLAPALQRSTIRPAAALIIMIRCRPL